MYNVRLALVSSKFQEMAEQIMTLIISTRVYYSLYLFLYIQKLKRIRFDKDFINVFSFLPFSLYGHFVKYLIGPFLLFGYHVTASAHIRVCIYGHLYDATLLQTI